jgi:hypothetical protein
VRASIPNVRLVVVATLLAASVVARHASAQTAIDVTPPVKAAAGSTVTVKWSGPNGPGDFVTVVREGARPFDYLDYQQTSNGRTPVNPVSIVLPAEPGAYEIRYVQGTPRMVLATVPYEISAVTATLDGPASVAPEARFEVTWSGPNNWRDWVTIVAAGAATRAYGSYVDARSGRAGDTSSRRTATLRAPKEPGRYELRYVQQGTRVIGTRVIEVTGATAGAPIASAPQMTAVPLSPSVVNLPVQQATGSGPSADSPPQTPPATLNTGRTGERAMTAGAQQAIADAATAAANAAAETTCPAGTASSDSSTACATISGPGRLTQGSTGDFAVALRHAPGATTVTTTHLNADRQVAATVTRRTDVTADFRFDSGEGESQNRTFTSVHTSPVSFAPASVTFTFQSTGTFTVVTHVIVTARTSIQTDTPIYDPTTKQRVRVDSTYSEMVEVWNRSVRKVVTVAAAIP